MVLTALVIFLCSLFLGKFIPFTFIPNSDNPEFQVTLKGPPSMALDTTRDWAKKVSDIIRSYKEIEVTDEVVGDTQGNENVAIIYARLVNLRWW